MDFRNRIMTARIPFTGALFGGAKTQSLQSPLSSRGGVRNPYSGLGSGIDKNVGTSFARSMPTQYTLDLLCVESWYARAFVNLLVDDMFILWRTFEGAEGERMQDAEVRFDVRDRLAAAVKNGRKYGTGLLVMITRDGSLTEPLIEDEVRPDDLLHLLVSHRWNATVEARDEDLFSPTFGQPLIYRIRAGRDQYLIHHSRVLRFDGGDTPGVTIGTQYSTDWSASPLIPALSAAYGEAAMAAAINHLAQESSIATLKIKGFDQKIADHGFSGTHDTTPSIQEILEDFTVMKSSLRTNVIDAESDVERTEVQWRGMDRIIDINYKRLAAIVGVPATRLLGAPPVGFNATGESDMRNYAMHVKALQEQQLSEPLARLDLVVARSVGLADPPEYDFKPLTDMSDLERSQVALNIANATQAFHSIGAVDEFDAMEAADQLGIYPDDLTDSPPPGEPKPEMMFMPAQQPPPNADAP